jgi:hypothetical protein
MSTITAEARLAALKRSLEAARDTEHPVMASLSGHYRDIYEQHLQGLTTGLQIAIDAIEFDLQLIAAGQAVIAAYAQPE